MTDIICKDCGHRFSGVMYTCPNCGTNNRDSIEYAYRCPMCGNKFNSNSPLCPRCGISSERQADISKNPWEFEPDSFWVSGKGMLLLFLMVILSFNLLFEWISFEDISNIVNFAFTYSGIIFSIIVLIPFFIIIELEGRKEARDHGFINGEAQKFSALVGITILIMAVVVFFGNIGLIITGVLGWASLYMRFKK
jgi:hypothetical protein